MRFRFCGDADCPDWVLAEIIMLSRLSSVKLKQLGNIVAQSVAKPPLDIVKAEKLFADSQLDSDIDLKRCIACISFILQSAVRFGCDQTVLFNELQQLGLPREHSQAIRKIYNDHSNIITTTLKNKSLRVNKLGEVSVDNNSALKVLSFNIVINGEREQCQMSIDLAQSLLKDLKEVKLKLEELNSNEHAF